MDSNANCRVSEKRVHKPNRRTFASQYNLVLTVLAGLQRALEMHPEKDILTLLSASYSKKLEDFKDRGNASKNKAAKPGSHHKVFPKADVRSRLCVEDEASFLFGPSPELEQLLFPDYEEESAAKEEGGDESDESDSDTRTPLAEVIIDILDDAKVLYEGVWAASRMVFQLSDTLVAKFAEEDSAVDEYRALKFLRHHLPEFPAPCPHGVVVFGCYGILFTDFVAGCDLAQQWPRMSPGQKQHISGQLNALFTKLRSLPQPPNTPLGALQSGGRCKDGRRSIRSSTEPMWTAQDFQDWIFSGSSFAQPVFIKFLRDLLPQTVTGPAFVFTHGDLRLENMIVRCRDGREGCDDEWEICAVIDWETSGFYPEYWESVKITNGMISAETSDWFNCLPACISPQRYAVQWAVDRVWGPCL